MSVQAQMLQAWLLHSRPFRDSSMLLEFLTLEKGRVTAIARGIRSVKKQGRSLPQSFTPLNIVLTGKNELQLLRSLEPRAPGLLLHGEKLFAAMYLNELLVKLLPPHEAEEDLFAHYERTLHTLLAASSPEPALRMFELHLLEVLGYGLQFDHDASSGEAIAAGNWYYLQADSGFVKQVDVTTNRLAESGLRLYPGEALLSIADGDFSAAATRSVAKQLLRQALQIQLGDREISSRKLFTRNN